MAAISIPQSDAIAIVDSSAEAAWDVSPIALHGPSRKQPLAFYRQLCIAHLAEEFGMRHVDACRAYGRSVTYFAVSRRMLIKRLGNYAWAPEAATKFLEALDRERGRYLSAVAAGASGGVNPAGGTQSAGGRHPVGKSKSLRKAVARPGKGRAHPPGGRKRS